MADKSFQGSDNSIPLSPQWLQPKPGENRTGVATGENHFSPLPVHSNSKDTTKLPGAGDVSNDNQNKKDVFRPSIREMESGRRDRWRDEERDTNSFVRKDRWRDGEKEHLNNRWMDRWTESSGKQFGDGRRVPGERWADSASRESHDQRRESKWNTRWGPDDKEADAIRGKLGGFNKEADTPLDKGSFQPQYHVNDERDGDHHRPWRSNSSYSRDRADHHHQASTPNKQASIFSQGQERGENPAPTSSPGRFQVSSAGSFVTHTAVNLQAHGPVLVKVENDDGEPHSLKYSRTKLIDIYRKFNMRSYAKFLEGVVQVPSLTQEESVEPLAFHPPTPEESVILKGIEKGEIMSSGAPQISKDGSVGRATNDFMHSRRHRLGSRDNLADSLGDPKYESVENVEGRQSNYYKVLSPEKQIYSWSNAEAETTRDYQAFSNDKMNAEEMKEDSVVRRQKYDVSTNRESSASGHTGLWRSSSLAERSNSISHDSRELSIDFQKDLNNVLESSLMDSAVSPNTRKGPNWQMGDHPFIRRQSSAALDREMEHPILQQSPEELVLYYKDPQGEIQGPFAGSDIISWFEGGYFGLELQVRLAGAPPDAPFSFLGDVMPHLHSKARAPPGFSTPKLNEIQDTSATLNYGNFGKLLAVPNEIDALKEKYIHGSTTEAENRFLESLMAGSMNTTSFEKFALSEGMQGYGGNNSNAHPLLGSNSGDDAYLVAKKMALERQRSLSTPHLFWPGRDAASLSAKTDIVNDTSKLLSSIADNTHPQNHSQDVSLMSILQGLSERTTSTVNNGIGDLLNFPVQGGFDPLQDNLNIHHSQNFHPQSAIGIQQQRLQLQNPSLNNLLAQSLDNQTNILTLEKLIASGLSQDPQVLGLLQQQYMLQLQSQAPVTPQQLSLLDKMLLLKQQQKQEEQQRLLHQQQQLLSQMLSEHQPNKQFGEQSFLQLQTGGLMAGNANVDNAQFQPPHDLFQMGVQSPALNLQGENANTANNLLRAPSTSGDISQHVAAEASMHVQHETLSNKVELRNWVASTLDQIKQQKGSSVSAEGDDMTPMSEMATRSPPEQTSHADGNVGGTTSNVTQSLQPLEHSAGSVSQQLSAIHENDLLIHENVNVLTETSAKAFERSQDEAEKLTSEPSPVKEKKISEAQEVKKPSEKRSKKQRASKVSTDSIRGASKPQLSKTESEGTSSGNAKSETLNARVDALDASLSKKEKKKTEKVAHADVDLLPGKKSLPAGKPPADDDVTNENKGQPGQLAYLSEQAHAGQRAWKPAPGFKPKSLLEIQQEEQRRTQEEMAVPEISTSLSSLSISSPWGGMVLNSDNKALNGTHQDASTGLNFGKSENSSGQKSKKSQVEDLFWDDVAKSVEREMEISDSAAGVPSKSITSSQTDNAIGDDFIEAKDTKKSRKKSSKAKSAGGKVTPAGSVDASVGSSSFDKGKNTHEMQPEKEVLPAVPSGPSLGDFVVWKGESTSPSPAPAWSIDSGKSHKPASLRDILKEQERKVFSPAVQLPTPQKTATNQPAHGSGPSRPFSSSSPAKVAAPIQINVQASSHGKHKVEDDLFWGPLDQAKPDAKQSDFPQVGTQSSWGGKSTPVKGTLGGSLNRQKSIGGNPAEFSTTTSASSTQKGKKNALTKHSEAMDFKEWCENECIRLVGSKDTSFLEFCLKQSREEAEMLLVANLGSFDPDHKFIHKFLDYKDFLPADVLEIALKNRNDQKATVSEVGDMTSDFDTGNGTAKGGKKKGKKGKKVSPSVLGFNVVSNRIMMGEIQTVDD